MRNPKKYIDMDVIEDTLRYFTEFEDSYYAGDLLLDIWKTLDVAPAADVQPVKCGQWIGVSPMMDTLQCSICGNNILSEEMKTPFCPWCGAHMHQ